jgi:hypothetical protein
MRNQPELPMQRVAKPRLRLLHRPRPRDPQPQASPAWRRPAALVGSLAAALGMAAACHRDPTAEPVRKEPVAQPGSAPPSPPPPLGDLAWLTRDAELVIGVNVAQLRGTNLWRRTLEPLVSARLPATLAAARAQCGLDLLASFDVITIGLRSFDRILNGQVITHGADTQAWWSCLHTLEPALARDGLDVTWRGPALLLHSALGNTLALTRVDDRTTRGLFSPEAVADDVATPDKQVLMMKDSAGFAEMYRSLPATASLWFVVNGKGDLLAAARTQALELQAVFGSIVVADGLRIAARLRTTTPELAQRLAATARERLAQSAIATYQPEFGADQQDVTIAATCSEEQLAALLERLAR